MTPKQTKWYWQLWNNACRVNAWRMQDCCLQHAATDDSQREPIYTVLVAAARIAADLHRAATLDDVRHAVHLVASGRACGHEKIGTKEFGRVKTLLQLLANPDDLAAMNEWLNPELDERRRALAVVMRAPPAYYEKIAQGRFGTRNIDSLDLAELRSLALTLANRDFSERKPFEAR